MNCPFVSPPHLRDYYDYFFIPGAGQEVCLSFVKWERGDNERGGEK